MDNLDILNAPGIEKFFDGIWSRAFDSLWLHIGAAVTKSILVGGLSVVTLVSMFGLFLYMVGVKKGGTYTIVAMMIGLFLGIIKAQVGL